VHLVVVAETAVATTVGTGKKLLAVVVALAGLAVVAGLGLAAADGEDPEEAGGDGKGGTDPDSSKEAGVHTGIGIILVANGFDSTDDH
jgi:hypothetical protein